jgi:hypothetical protein
MDARARASALPAASRARRIPACPVRREASSPPQAGGSPGRPWNRQGDGIPLPVLAFAQVPSQRCPLVAAPPPPVAKQWAGRPRLPVYLRTPLDIGTPLIGDGCFGMSALGGSPRRQPTMAPMTRSDEKYAGAGSRPCSTPSRRSRPVGRDGYAQRPWPTRHARSAQRSSGRPAVEPIFDGAPITSVAWRASQPI